MWQLLQYFAVSCVLSLVCTARSEVSVCTLNGGCSQNDLGINGALEEVSSDTILYFDPGIYSLDQFKFLVDLNNVSFIGLGKDGSLVTCEVNAGLAFFNVSNVVFQNLQIQSCGFAGLEAWMPVLAASDAVFDRLFQIPASVGVALFLGNCENATFSKVRISNTTGIGLLAINAIGQIYLNDVHFQQNRAVSCVPLTLVILPGFNPSEWIGGGAYFLYEDYRATYYFPPSTNLMIANSTFINNTDCGVTGSTEIYIEYSTSIQEYGYVIGAGGGLSVMMTQVGYPVDVKVYSTTFQKNMAKFGAGAHIGLFAGTTNCHVEFHDCTFDGNGAESGCFGGGGLATFFDLTRPPQMPGEFPFPDIGERNNSLQVVSSSFTRNVAVGGGGAYVLSNYAEEHIDNTTEVYFKNCTFDANLGYGSSALFAYERKAVGLDPGMQVELCDVTVTNNILWAINNISITEVFTGGIINIVNLRATICGKSAFTNNQGSALVGTRAAFDIKGNVVFADNNGVYGGAMQLNDYTFIIMHQNANLLFSNNVASISGGAIYANVLTNDLTFGYDDCFLYFQSVNVIYCTKTTCDQLDNLNISINFTGNSALLGGTIYGSTLETCSWSRKLKTLDGYDHNVTLYENLYLNSKMISFDPMPVGPEVVSTKSSNLQINSTEPPTIMPGQQFNIKVGAFDRFSQPIPEGIASSIQSSGDMAKVQLGASGYWFLDGRSGSINTPITITGTPNQTVAVLLYSTASSAAVSFSATLVSCVAGFFYSETNNSCICDKRLVAEGIVCDANKEILKVPDHTWVGPVEDDHGKNSESENDKLVVHDCVLDYCRQGEKIITAANYSSQCSEGYHRTGLLCGTCRDGYSIQLGSYRCQKCTHYHLFLLIFFFAAGITLIFAMACLHITVTEGYLNSILFYSNVVNLFVVEFSPITPNSGVFIPTSFLSLDLGIESCFYDGMNALVHSSLRLAFVAYLFILMGGMTLLGRILKHSKVSKYSPIKVFATLTILCYVSVLQSCIAILAPIHVHTLDGESSIRWHVDPTVHYFQREHGLLGFVAVILVLTYIIPLPILALFPSKMYRMRYTRKFKPLYDALWAPFEPKFRFWLGFRLILRWIPFSLAYFVLSPHNVFALGLFLVLLLSVQIRLNPFRGSWRNFIEDCLVANMILLVIGSLYFRAIEEGDKDLEHQTIYTGIIAFLAYIIFVGVFIRHLFLRFPNLKQDLRNLPKRIKRKAKEPDGLTTASSVDAPSSINSESPNTSLTRDKIGMHCIWQNVPLEQEHSNIITKSSRPRVINFTELRESILEDEGEVEATTTAKTI